MKPAGENAREPRRGDDLPAEGESRGGGFLSRFVARGRRVAGLCRELLSLPPLTVHLMISRAEDNEEFFRRHTRAHYREARRRHRKFPLVRALEYGFAVKILEARFEDYFMSVEGSARRNCKKARRHGFVFGRIDYNEHIEDIREILRSTPCRQGRMPEELVQGRIRRVNNPATRNCFHDYPFYGVMRDGVVYAYAGCLVAGEICLIETIYGHAGYQSFGIVPLLIISIAEDLLAKYPHVRYYGYGTMFGASEELQRFKRKFRFLPMKVTWELE